MHNRQLLGYNSPIPQKYPEKKTYMYQLSQNFSLHFPYFLPHSREAEGIWAFIKTAAQFLCDTHYDRRSPQEGETYSHQICANLKEEHGAPFRLDDIPQAGPAYIFTD